MSTLSDYQFWAKWLVCIGAPPCWNIYCLCGFTTFSKTVAGWSHPHCHFWMALSWRVSRSIIFSKNVIRNWSRAYPNNPIISVTGRPAEKLVFHDSSVVLRICFQHLYHSGCSLDVCGLHECQRWRTRAVYRPLMALVSLSMWRKCTIFASYV